MGRWIMAGIIGSTSVIGMLAVCWVVAGWAERAADCWRDWHELVDDSSDLEEYDPTGLELGKEIEQLLGLPPERTWEQMTSHQLPVVRMGPEERKHWHKLERARRQRCKRVEMTHRAHYAAMGLDYPSGLLARVRESVR